MQATTLNTNEMGARDPICHHQDIIVEQQQNIMRQATATTTSATTTQHDTADTNANDADANDAVDDFIALNGRPVAVGLRRQPTIYPHGLNISVRTISHVINSDDSESYKSYNSNNNNYSRASTLRSEGWSGQQQQQHTLNNTQTATAIERNCHRKYRISMIGNPESLAELHVRRYKYPLTGNYYLDPQDQMTSKTPLVYKYYECAKRYCRWKYIRWPIIFLASVLLFFGIITYCIWLHDVSVARQRYLQQRRHQYNLETAADFKESNEYIQTNVETKMTTTTTMKTTTTTTERSHRMQESTFLRAIGTGTRTRQRPKEQTLTTRDYDVLKGTIEWQKQKINQPKKTTVPATSTEDSLEKEYSDEEDEEGEGDYVEEPVQGVHFTSGHQNSFGVPIEEDERILRIINGLNQNEPVSTSLTPRTKVSPTIPPVKQFSPTAAMETDARPTAFNSPENGCFSTSLPMCQGVLEYDLTYNSTTAISPLEQSAFENLIYSNCSARAVEFICALFEPECRPSHIGVLPPCRRICKAIFEACSVEIVSSDILSNIFDCTLYPDSSDAHKCEDPTRRRDYCYNNEFECYDHTCIPQQWQCDNIKDCVSGEDEDECLQCDHQDEFRCHTNDKCVPESVRCDSKQDCADGSDEADCDEYGSGDISAAAFDEAAVNTFPHVFSYASYLSPNQTNGEGLYGYVTATNDDENGTRYEIHDITNRTSGVSKEDVTNNVPEVGPKGFVNFRDSKEIMMTSDSENKFKYSAIRNRNTSRYTTPAILRLTTTTTTTTTTTPAKTTLQTLQATASRISARTTRKPTVKVAESCAQHQLRCISGKCITVAQLCDKKIDCPDGADELMCTYKAERSTTKRYTIGQTGKIDLAVTTDSTRNDKRTIRTTTLRRRTKA